MTQVGIDDVAVVGGGIIGLTIAREAAHAGLRVRLFERGRIGAEASGAAAGLLSPQAEAEPGDPLFLLGLASRDLYPDFVDRVTAESGLDPALSRRGTLVVAAPGAEALELDRRGTFLRSLDLPAERVEGDALRRIEPSIHPDLSEGLWLPRDLSVDNVVLLQGLRRSVERLGVVLQEGTKVDRLLIEKGRVVGLEAAGARVPAGDVVLAAGAWSGEIAGPGLPPLPAYPVRGQIVCFGPAPAPGLPLFGRDGYLVPRRDGRVLAGSTMERAGYDTSVTGEGLRRLCAMAMALVPDLARAPFHSAWAGLRPALPDGLPAIGRTAAGLLCACGHLRNGILLAPITARIIARLVAGEDPGFDLSPYDPLRFVGGERRAEEPRGEGLSGPRP